MHRWYDRSVVKRISKVEYDWKPINSIAIENLVFSEMGKIGFVCIICIWVYIHRQVRRVLLFVHINFLWYNFQCKTSRFIKLLYIFRNYGPLFWTGSETVEFIKSQLSNFLYFQCNDCFAEILNAVIFMVIFYIWNKLKLENIPVFNQNEAILWNSK